MGYVTTRRTRLQTQLTRTQTLLTALYENYGELIALPASYAFDSGEGSQRTTQRKINDMLENIQQLEATESHLINELSGMGLVNVRLRRKSGGIQNRHNHSV